MLRPTCLCPTCCLMYVACWFLIRAEFHRFVLMNSVPFVSNLPSQRNDNFYLTAQGAPVSPPQMGAEVSVYSPSGTLSPLMASGNVHLFCFPRWSRYSAPLSWGSLGWGLLCASGVSDGLPSLGALCPRAPFVQCCMPTGWKPPLLLWRVLSLTQETVAARRLTGAKCRLTKSGLANC